MTADLTLPINSRPGDLPLDTPVEILCSYFYFKKHDLGTVNSWGTSIIADSGAFSAMNLGELIDREEFHAWAHRWKDNTLWVASLDKIGDVKGTRHNWEAARRDGLDLVPTLHYLEPATTLDWYVEQGCTMFGLGGMVPLKSEHDRLLRWLIGVFRYARDNHPGIRFHGWGTTARKLVDNLPWYSVDSSGFTSAFRFGRLPLWDPRRGISHTVAMDGRQAALHRRLLAEFYGVNDWRRIAVSTPFTRRDLGRVAYRSLQYYSDWLRSRQIVSAPSLLLDRENVPRIAGVAVGCEGMLIPDSGPRLSGVISPSSQVGRSISPTDEPPPIVNGPRVAEGSEVRDKNAPRHPPGTRVHAVNSDMDYYLNPQA